MKFNRRSVTPLLFTVPVWGRNVDQFSHRSIDTQQNDMQTFIIFIDLHQDPLPELDIVLKTFCSVYLCAVKNSRAEVGTAGMQKSSEGPWLVLWSLSSCDAPGSFDDVTCDLTTNIFFELFFLVKYKEQRKNAAWTMKDSGVELQTHGKVGARCPSFFFLALKGTEAWVVRRKRWKVDARGLFWG